MNEAKANSVPTVPFLLTALGSAGTILASSALLSWVAFFNGAPLVFADTIAYATAALQREVPGVFSVFYSALILPLHFGVTLWPVVLVQGALLSHLLYLVVRTVSGGRIGRAGLLVIIGMLSLFSGLPWITGQILPDAFSPVVILGFFLLAFCLDQLSRGERVYVCGLTTAAITTHFSHVPIAVALILLCLGLRWLFRPKHVKGDRTLLLVSVGVALMCMLAVNWIDSRTIGLARNSNVFLLAKLIHEGPGLSYLSQACESGEEYRLCSHLGELTGKTQEDLKWKADSPFEKVGGFDELEPEARHIVWGTLRTYPVEILLNAIADVGRQLTRFEAGDGLTPHYARLVAYFVGQVFGPDEEASIAQSRQAHEALPIAEFRRLHQVALFLAMTYCLWAVTVRRTVIPKRLLLLHIFVLLGIVVNAAATGALSGPYDRYLARVIWLICFTALLGLALSFNFFPPPVAEAGRSSPVLKRQSQCRQPD